MDLLDHVLFMNYIDHIVVMYYYIKTFKIFINLKIFKYDFFFCTLYFTLQKVLQSILVSELSGFLCLEV